MKKTLGLAVLIIVTVIFAYVYRLQTVAYIDVPVRAVEKGELNDALKNGLSDPDEQGMVGLSSFESGEPVYRRGNRYYLGAQKSPIDLTWPFYTNEGTALYFMSDQTGLIASDFAVFEAYEGLLISNGTAFYIDMSQVDDEEYILASLTGGLYMNVQPMTISSSGLTTEIKLNSVLNLSPELIRSYYYQDDLLVYREDKVMYGSQVTIGSVSMSYEDFLAYLGMTQGIDSAQTPLGNFPGVDLDEEDTTDSQESQAAKKAAGGTGEGQADRKTDDGISTDESSGTAAAENGGEIDTSAQNEKEGSVGNNDLQSDRIGSEGGSGSTGGSSSGSSFGSSGGSSSSSSGSSSAGSANGSGSGSGNGDGSGSGGGNNGGSPADHSSDEYIEPTTQLDNLKMGVYTMGGKLTITDPQSRVVRVIIRLYNNGKQSSRKNMRESGDISITNLAPETVYEIRGEIIFRNESGVRETKQFLEGLEVSTLPISTLDPITLTFGDATEYLPKKISIPDILLTGAESVDGGEVLLSQASKIRFVSGSTELFITGTTIRKARSGEAVTWTSEEVFASHTDYPFTVEVQDRFGNVLPLTDGTGGSAVSRTGGTAHTCYITPTATLTEESNQVGLQTIGVRLTNTDNVALSNCYLKVLNSDGDALPAFSQVGSDPNTMYQRAVNTSTSGLQTIDLTMLSSGISCRVVVTADFDLDDRPSANPRTGQELGRISIYTAPISRLGYAYVSLSEVSGTTASSFGVTARVNTSRTQQGLLELMTEMPVVITDSTGAEVYRGEDAGGEQIFSKEYLEAIAIGSGAAQLTICSAVTTLKLPQIVMTSLPSDSTNAWEAYTGGAQVTLAFPDGTFQSKTVYTVTAKATAHQGGTDYSVGSSVNVLGIQTMRKPAAFTYSEEFSISDFYELYGFCAEDPDETIPGGTVLLRLYSEGSLVSSQTLNTNVTYEKLRLDSLKQNTTYTIRFYTALYNEGYTSETQELNKLFDTEYTFTTGQGILGSIEMQGVTVNGTYDVDASMNVVLTDQRSELNNGAYQVLIYGAAGIDTSDSRLTLQETLDDNIDTGTAQYTKNFVYNGNKNWKYRADLVVEVRGYEIVLDNTSFTTETNMDTISSWAEMKTKVNADPAGKYVVISDFDKTDNTGIPSSSRYFTGSIDFQGHKVTTVNNYTYHLIQYLGPTGVIENLQLDYNYAGTSNLFQHSGVVNYNYGTVRNVIVNMNWSGKYYHSRAAGIVSYNRNTGIIEDFVVRLMNDLYVGVNTGGAAYSNEGTIRRGYVASGSSGSVSGIIAGSGVYGGSSGSRAYVGGICGTNSGVIEDTFSLVNVSMETGTNMDYIGGVVGYSSGTVRNSFFVGDIYQFGFNSDKTQTASSLYRVGGGIVGLFGSAGRYSGLYNFSLEADPNDSSKPAEYGYNTSGTRTKVYAETGELQRLWDSIWYEGIFASPDQFYIEDQVAAGYYPKLKISDALAASQESISLPAAPAVNAPEYVSNVVDSQTNDTAVLTLYFRNPNAYEITQISINSLTTEIVSQKTEGNFYEVKVNVSNPVQYLSQYNLGYVIYRRTATSTPTTVQYGDVKTAYVAVKFYKGISTVDEWAAMEYDLESNYMLEADINFSTAATDKMVITGTFQGELKGNGYTLKNLKPGSNYAYIFESASGAVFTNLKVDGLAFTVNDTSTAKASAVQAGFVGSATETDFADVFLTDVSMTGMPGSAGALVGAATYGSITDCRAEEVSIVTASYTGRPLRTGGLVGLAASIAIKNCYVSGLDLEAAQGVSSQGIGGLAGQVTGSDGVSNCYVQGQIQSSFDRTGGAVGSGQADLSNIWTFVNVSCNMPGMGGILGYGESNLVVKNSLVIGNMVTSASSGFGRIYGAVASSAVVVTVSDTVAYSGQIAGTGVSGETLGANVLVSGADLDSLEVYRDDARLGESFDLEGESGYLIAEGYMPMILSYEGVLLTPQTPVMRRDERLSIVDASLTQNQSGGTYTLQIIVEVGESPFEPTGAECAAMELGDGTIVYYDETNRRWRLTYPEVTLSQYLSLYQINVLFQSGESSQILSCQITGTFSRTIRNANEWVTAMKAYGQDYENFVITGDIDLSGVSQSMLEDGLMNLKINSLKSSGGTHTIKGLTYTTTTNGESMISSLSGSIENLVFEDITINNTGRSGEYIGVIGKNQGTIQNQVTFRRITVNGNTGSYLGCVGYNTGTLTGITLEDVSITGSTSASKYVGGLVGYNTGTVNNITAEGSSSAGFLNYAGYKAKSTTISSQLPVEQDYSYIVKGYQGVGGIIGNTTVTCEQMAVKSVYVEGNTNVGGVIGSSAGIYGISSNMVVGDSADQMLPVRVVGKSNTGGVFGYATSTSSGYAYLDDSQIYHSFISGTTYTGGFIGQGSGWGYYCRYSQAVSITIMATGGSTAGISGYGPVAYCEVRDCDIAGTSTIGGITGTASAGITNLAVIDTRITGSGSNIGGIVGNGTIQARPVYVVVTGCEITGTQTAAKIGGVVGVTYRGVTYGVVTDTKVSGYSSVGGVVGETLGGYYYRVNCQADVESSSGMAGALAGLVYDFDNYSTGTVSDRQITASYLNLGGSVKAPSYCSAFIGRLSYKPAKRDMSGNIVTRGNSYLDSTRYNRILLTSSVICTSDAAADQGTASRWAYFSLAGNATADQISTTDEDYASPARIDTITGTSAYGTVWKGVTVTDSYNTSIMSTPADYSQWSTSTGSGMTLVGYSDMVTADFWSNRGMGSGTTYGTTAALTANPPRIPYIVYNSATIYDGEAMLNYQNGTVTGADGQPLATFDIPTGTEVMALSSRSLTVDLNLATAYASGPATLNLELVEGLDGMTLAVSDGTGELLSAVVDKRVYSLPYDFSTPLMVTLSYGDYVYEYQVAASDVIHTVMNWDGNYYYLTSEGVRSSSGDWEAEEAEQLSSGADDESDTTQKSVKVTQQLLEGQFLHLYKGRALDADGSIWNVKTGKRIKTVDFTNLQWEDTVPLQSYNNNGTYLDVYAGFTESTDSSSGESTILDSQTFIKDGRLYALDGSLSVKTGAVLADYYSGSRYFTVLGEDGTLHDIETGITLPEGFTNMSIKELADNLDSDAKIAIGRYSNGSVFAFNYLTGTMQELNEDTYYGAETTGLLDYASEWLDSTMGSWFGFNNSTYDSSVSQMNELSAALGQLSSSSSTPSPEVSADNQSDGSDTPVAADSSGQDSAAVSGDSEASSDSSGTGTESVGEASDTVSENDGNGDTESANENSLNSSISRAVLSIISSADSDSLQSDISAEENNSKTDKEDSGDSADSAETTSGSQEEAEDKQTENSETQATGEETAADENQTIADAATDAKTEQSISSEELSESGVSGSGTGAGGTESSASETITSGGGEGVDASGDGTLSEGTKQEANTVSGEGSDQQTNTAAEDGSDKQTASSAAGTSKTNGTTASDGAVQNENTESATNDPQQNDRKIVQMNSQESMVSVYDADSGEYQIYDIDELLSAPRSQLVSVDEKVEQLAEQGLITYQSSVDPEKFVEENRHGVMIFAATTVTILLLLLYLADKKRG